MVLDAGAEGVGETGRALDTEAPITRVQTRISLSVQSGTLFFVQKWSLKSISSPNNIIIRT